MGHTGLLPEEAVVWWKDGVTPTAQALAQTFE